MKTKNLYPVAFGTRGDHFILCGDCLSVIHQILDVVAPDHRGQSFSPIFDQDDVAQGKCCSVCKRTLSIG